MIHTKVCDVLGIVHPIVQAGMAGPWFTNAELVAEVSNAGGLGILGCLGHTAESAVAEIRRIRTLTNRPFGVNFVLHRRDDEAFTACLEERVPVYSFFRGDPTEAVTRAHEVGALTIHQVTTPVEAVHACEAGVDVLIAQGVEAGGHMGPLLLLNLLPEVISIAADRPVLAAGGIVDGRGLAAMLCLGAAGVVMGTRFLATPEAPISNNHKQALLAANGPEATVASELFDIIWGDPWPGVRVRALRNKFVNRWLGKETALKANLPKVGPAYQKANEADDPEEYGLLAGTGAGRINDLKPAGDIVKDTVAEATRILRELTTR